MRGGFGRFRYERPQPGLQINSYEDALYPPRAYRYHIQQNAAPQASTATAAGRNTANPSSSNANATSAESLATAIVLPTIDADATCGPYLKGSGSSSNIPGGVSGSASVASGATLGYLGRSASSVASSGVDGGGPNAAHPMDAERRPPPRLRYFFDCFVPDEDGADVQTLAEVCRHAEPLNPFHYRELWGGGVDGVTADVPTSKTIHGAVKAEPVRDDGAVGGDGGSGAPAQSVKVAVKGEGEEKAKVSAATRAATRAAQQTLQRTLRALGLTDELSSMVLLAARVPPGGKLTRRQEKLLRLRHQRRPAPPRPIRRGAKVFMPAYALLAGGAATADAYGLTAEAEATAATGGLIDVTAAGPRVLRVQHATAHQRGAFGVVGGGGGTGQPYGGGMSGLHTTSGVVGRGGGGGVGGGSAAATSALLSEFAFDDDDDDDTSAQGRGVGGGGHRRAAGKRGRGGDDYEGMEEGDIPLIASGRWSQLGGPGSGANGANGGLGAGGSAAAAAAAAAAANGQLDEEAEEGSDEEDDLSAAMDRDDDDDANFSDDGGNDNDSFGGGDDGNDDY